eukprot:scaffold600228_cov41-Prasinocladus_malaysianus.AAC.2
MDSIVDSIAIGIVKVSNMLNNRSLVGLSPVSARKKRDSDMTSSADAQCIGRPLSCKGSCLVFSGHHNRWTAPPPLMWTKKRSKCHRPSPAKEQTSSFLNRYACLVSV